MSQLLGIDAGNTMIKAVLFDQDGTLRAVAHCAGETHQPQPGFAERPIADIWRGVSQAVRACLAQVPDAQVVAVGAAGHGNGLYALDKQQQPLIGIQSIDSRATERAHQLEAPPTCETIYAISRQKVWASSTPVLMSWIKRQRPDLWQRVGHIMLAKDVIAHFLTGSLSTDYSDAAGSGLYDHQQAGYSPQLMALYDLVDALPLLPPLHDSSQVVGHVTPHAAELTGLPVGIPVVAGLFDVVASAIGSGVVACGEASIVAGTWSINQVVVPDVDYRRPVMMSSLIEHDRYMAIEASATSTTNLDWFVREFDDGRGGGGGGAARSSDLVSQVKPDIHLPFYHPYLYAGRKDTPAKAGFYGLSGWHTRADMLFALFEGVTFAHRAHIDRLRAAGLPFERATLSGGATRSSVWPQMFADVLGIPIRIAECPESGALGAAICAGVGVGIWPDLAAGVNQAVKLNPQRFVPDPDRQRFFQQRYERFKKLELAMDSIWQTDADIL